MKRLLVLFSLALLIPIFCFSQKDTGFPKLADIEGQAVGVFDADQVQWLAVMVAERDYYKKVYLLKVRGDQIIEKIQKKYDIQLERKDHISDLFQQKSKNYQTIIHNKNIVISQERKKGNKKFWKGLGIGFGVGAVAVLGGIVLIR